MKSRLEDIVSAARYAQHCQENNNFSRTSMLELKQAEETVDFVIKRFLGDFDAPQLCAELEYGVRTFSGTLEDFMRWQVYHGFPVPLTNNPYCNRF
jgi:hypothetical protein